MTSLLSRPTKTLEVSKVYHSFINYKLIFFISYLYALKWNNDIILLSQLAWWKVPSLIWLWAWVTTFRSGGRPCNLVDSIECCSFLLVGKVAHDVFISLMKLVAYLTRGHGFFKPRVTVPADNGLTFGWRVRFHVSMTGPFMWCVERSGKWRLIMAMALMASWVGWSIAATWLLLVGDLFALDLSHAGKSILFNIKTYDYIKFNFWIF